jgi:hypothetical protein
MAFGGWTQSIARLRLTMVFLFVLVSSGATGLIGINHEEHEGHEDENGAEFLP